MKKILTFLFACLLTGTVCGVNVFADGDSSNPVANTSGTSGTWVVKSEPDSTGGTTYTNQQFTDSGSATDIQVDATITKDTTSGSASTVYYVEIAWNVTDIVATQKGDEATYTWDAANTKYVKTNSETEVNTIKSETTDGSVTITVTNKSNAAINYAISNSVTSGYSFETNYAPDTVSTTQLASADATDKDGNSDDSHETANAAMSRGSTDADKLTGKAVSGSQFTNTLKLTAAPHKAHDDDGASKAADKEVAVTYTVTLSKVTQ